MDIGILHVYLFKQVIKNMQSLAEFYIKRNTELLRQWHKLVNSGLKKGVATRQVAKNNEGVTEGLVKALIYQPEYPYAEEAREIIRKEEAEKVKENNDNRTVAAGEIATP